MSEDRVFYSSSVHDEREIEAVVEVLRSGPQGLWPGRRVVRMEREVSARFGKAHGIMCNSGSSALYLALELLALPPGAEVVTCALTFSTDVAPIVRGGWLPVFVDCAPLTYCVDVDRIEETITDRTGALLFPNLIGNAPDWDRIAEIAVRHDLPVIEDSCDTLGATLRGTPTGTRSTISVTSFANSHIITCAGNGGMVMTDGDAARDRAVMLRRWGRRSELHFFGSKRRDRDFWEPLDGIHYDNQFIFDELAWNFEPSELGAAFGLEQLVKLPDNLARRRRHFDRYSEQLARHEDRFALPQQLPELETAWLGFPLMLEPDAGFERADLQEFLDGRGIDTRTIWTGNVTRQPMLGGVEVRIPPGGLPEADAVMERGVLLPLSHAIDDDTLDFVIAQVEEFLGMIIDVDTHWEATSYASDEFPLAPWRDQLPGSLDMLAFGIAGDLLRALPDADRPSAMELLPNLVRMAEERGGPIILHPLHDSSAAERVGWMDRIGIDHCLVNPGGYWQQLEFLGPDRAAGVRRCNDFLGAALASESDRLHPVAVVDYADLDVAVEELQRARARGARAFFLSTEQGRPAAGISPGHPRWDPLWTAATRLGMVAVIHVGNTESDFTGWADIGWNLPDGAGVAGLTRLANTQRIHAAQNLLSALLYGGVFARHPTLTVMLEEMRVNWVPPFLQMLERQSVSSAALGDWPWEMSGGDMLRRNVRVTPLPGFGDVDALDVLAEIPDVVVWSSDYPHQEGNADPIELYRPALDDLDAELRTRFMGANAEECFARMGDPL